MKSKIAATLMAISALVSASAMASSNTVSLDWEGNNAVTFFQDDYENVIGGMMTSIGYDMNNNKRFYFERYYQEGYGDKRCVGKKNGERIDNSFYKVDGQPVKVVMFCGVDDSGRGYIQATPETEAGTQYVYGQFFKGKKVFIETNSEMKVYVSAIGFRQAWQSNKDAI